MPRIGDGRGQAENAGSIRRGEQRRAERASTERSRADGGAQNASSSDDVTDIRARQARLVEAAKNAPDVRADRVAQARARVQEGFYDRPEARSAIADRMLQSFGLED
jgi:anti-sigma28 factor (negative regulator of flagellin synthesis)